MGWICYLLKKSVKWEDVIITIIIYSYASIITFWNNICFYLFSCSIVMQRPDRNSYLPLKSTPWSPSFKRIVLIIWPIIKLKMDKKFAKNSSFIIAYFFHEKIIKQRNKTHSENPTTQCFRNEKIVQSRGLVRVSTFKNWLEKNDNFFLCSNNL